MKTYKKIKIIALILFVTIIILASFFGVYKKEDFRAVNIIKNYKLGMQFTNKVEFKGTPTQDEKEIIYDKDGNIIENDGKTDYSEENGYTVTTEKINNAEVLNEANYKLTKKILKDRLKGMGVGEYKLNSNNETGEISVILQENDDVHAIEEFLLQKGNFLITDKETGEVLLDNSQVKSTKVVYGPSQQDQSTTVVYLQIDFNKEGTKKLEEISQIYVATENEEKTEEENAKYVSVVLDDETLSSTYFGEKMSTGVLYIPITQATDSETLTNYVKQVNNISTVINAGKLPIEYDFEETVLETNSSQNNLIIGIAIPSVILLIACIALVIKFRAKGFIAAFMQIGYSALLLLVLRYTNVIITIQGIIGIGISAILNFAFNFVMLNSLKNKEKMDWKEVKKFAFWTMPIYVLAIILSFNSLTVVSSLGMTLVWGSICLYLYNLSLTKTALEMFSK